jgi:hypothetical protein
VIGQQRLDLIADQSLQEGMAILAVELQAAQFGAVDPAARLVMMRY